MVPGAPSFAPLAEHYLALLNLGRGARRAVQAVQLAMDVSADPVTEVCALLAEQDWRPHLPAAVAVVLGQDEPAVVDAVWEAFARSWVAPQLAVAVAVADAEFERRARAYLEASDGVVAGKQAAALLALCGSRSPAPRWVRRVSARPRVAAELAADAAVAGSAQIAQRWARRVVQLAG